MVSHSCARDPRCSCRVNDRASSLKAPDPLYLCRLDSTAVTRALSASVRAYFSASRADLRFFRASSAVDRLERARAKSVSSLDYSLVQSSFSFHSTSSSDSLILRRLQNSRISAKTCKVVGELKLKFERSSILQLVGGGGYPVGVDSGALHELLVRLGLHGCYILWRQHDVRPFEDVDRPSRDGVGGKAIEPQSYLLGVTATGVGGFPLGGGGAFLAAAACDGDWPIDRSAEEEVSR